MNCSEFSKFRKLLNDFKIYSKNYENKLRQLKFRTTSFKFEKFNGYDSGISNKVPYGSDLL